MTRRALVIDVGNTRLKWGLFADGNLARTGSVLREKLESEGMASFARRLPRKVQDVMVSNVAGAAFASRLAGVIGMHCECDVHFARSTKQAFGVTNAYRQPRRLGVDRWVAMIGARSKLRGALCVVDAGTAVTIDALDGKGRHLGGQIIPGLELMARSLASETSDIGPASTRAGNPPSGIGLFSDSTRKAVRAGAINAVCGAVDRSVRVLRAAGYRPRVVLTGGDASRILSLLDGKVLHRPHLVLEGLAFMLQGSR
ncbi:MAG: type III pantothenate kinase [Gammaproteobacteria bacterium]|nr:type III pantothenate kinase [Gammaproteobacteria bacterium]MDH5345377.1 type III pantothenate kinase [Gammaproteobacteria bacterium]